ncbi:proline-rich receptor-like protein kinase PERK1 [Tanacetum coccineum]
MDMVVRLHHHQPSGASSSSSLASSTIIIFIGHHLHLHSLSFSIYFALEYASTRKLSNKSDVFSLGVMLLEIVTGRSPVHPTTEYMDESLVNWVRELVETTHVKGGGSGCYGGEGEG